MSAVETRHATVRAPIRTKRLMDVVPTGVNPIVGLVVGAVVFALAASILFIPIAMVVGTGFTVRLARQVHRTATKNAARVFRDFIGVEPQHIDVGPSGYGTDLRSVSGSGIAYANGRLFVMEEGLAAEIPWEQVRSWSYEILGWQTTQAGASHAPDTPMYSINKAQEPRIVAHRASGFTVTTRDVEKTTWRFTTIDERVCTKWMEVLRQMREGELPAR